jgi:hypothetical protein
LVEREPTAEMEGVVAAWACEFVEATDLGVHESADAKVVVGSWLR